MTSAIRRQFLVGLFALMHLVLQPMAFGIGCAGAAEGGSGGCCCHGEAEASDLLPEVPEATSCCGARAAVEEALHPSAADSKKGCEDDKSSKPAQGKSCKCEFSAKPGVALLPAIDPQVDRQVVLVANGLWAACDWACGVEAGSRLFCGLERGGGRYPPLHLIYQVFRL